MQTPDPASAAPDARACFYVGRDSHGAWVAREQTGRCGGLFTSRTAAEKFARNEAGDDAIILASTALELDAILPAHTKGAVQ